MMSALRATLDTIENAFEVRCDNIERGFVVDDSVKFPVGGWRGAALVGDDGSAGPADSEFDEVDNFIE